jgi:hypothetical protein
VIILDTDALGHIQKKDPVGILIVDAIDTSPDRDIRITAVTACEMLEGASTDQPPEEGTPRPHPGLPPASGSGRISRELEGADPAV